MAMAGFGPPLLHAVLGADSEARGGWEKYTGNPFLGGQYGTCFDICVLRERGLYRMWVS